MKLTWPACVTAMLISAIFGRRLESFSGSGSSRNPAERAYHCRPTIQWFKQPHINCMRHFPLRGVVLMLLTVRTLRNSALKHR